MRGLFLSVVIILAVIILTALVVVFSFSLEPRVGRINIYSAYSYLI